MTITNSTIADNTNSDDYGYGAGISNWGCDLTVVNSTISGNSSFDSTIFNKGALDISFTTIAFNADPYAVAAIGNERIKNSIIAANQGINCSGMFASNLGGAYDSDGTCTGTASPGAVELGALTGGYYHPLLPGNPAINGAVDCVAIGGGAVGSLNGAPRPSGGACDAGSYEMP